MGVVHIFNTIMMIFLPIIFLGGIKAATITSPPQDATTLVGDTAVFNCTGEGDLLQWTYDGTTVDEQIAQQYQISIVHHNVSDGMVSSSLYINATLDNDETIAGCRIATMSLLDIVSIGACLHVRRISPVRDLSLSIDDVPYVTWTIPSVIATDISVSDIRYTVKLEGGNITITVNDIDDTYYQFTDITVLNCTVYTATVTAYDVNQMYSSETAMMENSTSVDTSKSIIHYNVIIIISDTSLSVIDTAVYILNNSNCYVTFTLMVCGIIYYVGREIFYCYNRSIILALFKK